MHDRDVSRQVLIEYQILGHVIAALRATLGWRVPGVLFSRKLQSLCFIGESFKRHLKHLMALEEQDGYMTVVLASRPELAEDVAGLQREHQQFRKSLRRLLVRLKQVQPTNRAEFDSITVEFAGLLDRLEIHGRKETDLLQEALLTDEGGEG